MRRLWRWQRTVKAKGRQKLSEDVVNVPEDWVNTQRAEERGVSTVQLRLRAKVMASKMKIEDFAGGPSWCMIYGMK